MTRWLPLLGERDPDAPLAWQQGQPISAARFVAEVQQLARALPATGPAVNLCHDRYHFALGLGAALLRGHDVGRVERSAAVEAGAAQQRQQHARLETVAVLRRYRGDDGQAGQRRPLHQRRQALGLGGDVVHQRLPTLEVRLRRSTFRSATSRARAGPGSRPAAGPCR